uniref:Uncharacterized protein n=1 Tax=Strigamia maritima TaxID=126957 RepID=T1JKK0_STRMM
FDDIRFAISEFSFDGLLGTVVVSDGFSEATGATGASDGFSGVTGASDGFSEATGATGASDGFSEMTGVPDGCLPLTLAEIDDISVVFVIREDELCHRVEIQLKDPQAQLCSQRFAMMTVTQYILALNKNASLRNFIVYPQSPEILEQRRARLMVTIVTIWSLY